MKIVHFSDSHVDFGSNMGNIDPTTRLPGRVMDCLDMIDSIADFAEDEDVDLIIFSGDAFHKYNPNPIYLNEFAKRITRMSAMCPVVLLVGNHDMSVTTSAVEIYNSLRVDNVIVGNDYQVHKVMTKSGIIQVATAPFPSRKLLGNGDTKKLLHDKIYALGNDITDEGPSILVGHFTVSGAQYGVERSYIIGEDATVDLSVLADPVWDYVALGHIHFHQCLNDDPPVVYAGSVDRVTFGEENENKGFVFVTIDDTVTWEFVQVDARPYITIDIRTLKSDPMPKILRMINDTDLSGAVVRVIIRVKDLYTSLVDQKTVLDVLEASGLYILSSLVIYPILSEIEKEDRIDSDVFNISMEHIDLVDAYLRNVGMDDKDMKKILPVAQKIINEVNNVNIE